jgi:diketogulonate reductase-like aldo/keto reductase
MFEHIINDLAAKEQNWDVLDVLRSVANEVDATPAQVALCWTTNQPGITAPIIGARNMKQLGDNLKAAELQLDEDSTALLGRVSQPRPNDYPYGPFGRKQVGRYVDSSDAVLSEVFAPSEANEGVGRQQQLTHSR